MPDSPAEKLSRAPLCEIFLLLLQHFRASLADAGLTLGADEARALAAALAAGRTNATTQAVAQHIAGLVDERLSALQARWQVDFAGSLRATMADIGPWRTTADYLALANAKAEAETGIALGAALLTATGRRDYAPRLLDVIAYDDGANDIDAIIARRILLHVSGVSGAQPDWLAQLQRWVAHQPPQT